MKDVEQSQLVERVARAVVERLGSGADVRGTVRAALEQMGIGDTGERHLPIVRDGEEAHVTPRGALMPDAPPEGQPPVDYCTLCIDQERARTRQRAVLTTTGRNSKGIVARITQAIADGGGDILDISQTLVSDYFTMIIVIDTAHLGVPFAQFKEHLVAVCREMELQAMLMHEDVMHSLQRI